MAVFNKKTIPIGVVFNALCSDCGTFYKTKVQEDDFILEQSASVVVEDL